MTLTFTIPHGDIGPGKKIQVNIPAGPVPIDDYIEAVCTDVSFGTVVIRGRATTQGQLTVQVVLGFDDGGVMAEGITSPPVNQETVCLQAQQFHANGQVVDASLNLCIYRWNSEGALHQFIGLATSRLFPNP